jgi:GntR family transcriptional regulator
MAPPLYQVVIDTIVGRIATGALPPGAMLPSEIQLGVELGVSQGTARKALMELEARGLVQRAQGRGTFVTVRTPESSLFNFFRLRRPDGSQVAPQLEREAVRRRRATVPEQRALHGKPEHVFEIVRLRRLDARHLVHEVSVVPAPLFPGLADRAPLPNTLYVFYQQAYSCIIARADERLRAVAASGAVAEELGLAEGVPAMAVERLAFDVLDRVVERRKSVFPTDTYEYFVSLS